jgi:hypothetical protein
MRKVDAEQQWIVMARMRRFIQAYDYLYEDEQYPEGFSA